LERSVRITKKGFIVNGRRLDFIAGEFHYWRVLRENWERILNRYLEIGIPIVSTYVPWNYHEVGEGVFDFSGETSPQRDLNGFIELVESKGLFLFLRPGPYIYAEWPHGGPPKEAVKYHRFHPEFLRRARQYIEAVCRTSIVPNQATKGGPIFLLQVDNEIDPYPLRWQRQLGIIGEGEFKKWLEMKYHSVDRLNEAWKSSFTTFEEVSPWMDPPGDPKYLNRFSDYREFLQWMMLQIVEKIASLYRTNGVTVPLIVNIYDYYGFHDEVKLSQHVDLVGLDIYLRRRVPWEEFLKLSEWVKRFSAFSIYPISIEFQSGIWEGSLHNTGPIDWIHERFMALSALAMGLKGWNWYMFVCRDNWVSSPINEWGETIKGMFSAMGEVIKIYRELQLQNFRRVTNISLFISPMLLHLRRRNLLNDGSDWRHMFNTLHRYGLDFTFYRPDISRERSELILIPGVPILSKKELSNILKVIEKGSKVVFNPWPPSYTPTGEPLKNPHLIHPISSLRHDRDRPLHANIGGHTFSSLYLYLFHTDNPLKAEVEGFEENSMIELGYRKRLGGGEILTVGAESSRGLLEAILSLLDIHLPVRSLRENIIATLHKSEEEEYLLFIINPLETMETTKVELKIPPGEWAVSRYGGDKDIITVEKSSYLYSEIGPKDVAIYKLTPKS